MDRTVPTLSGLEGVAGYRDGQGGPGKESKVSPPAFEGRSADPSEIFRRAFGSGVIDSSYSVPSQAKVSRIRAIRSPLVPSPYGEPWARDEHCRRKHYLTCERA